MKSVWGIFILVSTLSEYWALNSHPGLRTSGLITKFLYHYAFRYLGKDGTIFIFTFVQSHGEVWLEWATDNFIFLIVESFELYQIIIALCILRKELMILNEEEEYLSFKGRKERERKWGSEEGRKREV